jgi:hypothetical protein
MMGSVWLQMLNQEHGLNTSIDIKTFVCFSLKLIFFSGNSLPVSRPYFLCYFLEEVNITQILILVVLVLDPWQDILTRKFLFFSPC